MRSLALHISLPVSTFRSPLKQLSHRLQSMKCGDFMAFKQPRSFSNALILQADWEGGMANLAMDLKRAGKAVTKVLLHAGDWIYKWKGVQTVSFDAPIEAFEDWLRKHIKQQ